MFKAGKKKIIANLILAMFVINHTLPMGFCVVQNSSSKLRAAQPQTIKLETDIISKKNPKISLSLRDSDVKQVLRLLADKAGLNIIFHSSVDEEDKSSSDNQQGNGPQPQPQQQQRWGWGGNGPQQQQQPSDDENQPKRKITLDLVNVPLNDAFRMIIQVSGLSYYKDGNTLIISSASAAPQLNLSKQEISSIPVKYADAASMAFFLNKNIFSIGKPGLSNGEIAVVNTANNEILIFGTHNDYVMAKKIIEQFDKKPLEETFIVNHTTPREMAYLVCNVLFKNLKDAQELYSNSEKEEEDENNIDIKWEDEEADDDEEEESSSEESGSDESSYKGLADSKIKKVKLGKAFTACHYKNFIQQDSQDGNNAGNNAGNNNSDNSDNKKLVSLTNGGITVSFFPQRGTISVHGGSVQQMEEVRDFIIKNDKKQLQAYLEVSIIELSDNGKKEFDNFWGIYSNFFSASFSKDGVNGTEYPMYLKNNGPVSQSGIGVGQRFSGIPTVYYAMNYLINNNKGRVLANPRIVITNGEKAAIDLTSDYLQKMESESKPVQGGGEGQELSQTTISRKPIIGHDQGISVVIHPFISSEGYVTMNIAPKYATAYGNIPDPDHPTNTDLKLGTLLQRRNLNLKNIRIKDGETLVIGGMIREEEIKDITKVPFLGDIPGIGTFFRSTTNTKQKNELVIMLTPRIIKEDNSMAKRSDETL